MKDENSGFKVLILIGSIIVTFFSYKLFKKINVGIFPSKLALMFCFLLGIIGSVLIIVSIYALVRRKNISEILMKLVKTILASTIPAIIAALIIFAFLCITMINF